MIFLTEQEVVAQIERQGYIVSLGQISPSQKRKLDKRASTGALVKRRGFWDDPLGRRGFGIGPLKTIYIHPSQAPQ